MQRTILTLFFLISGFFSLSGQTKNGSLILKIRQDKQKLWYHARLSSNDTIIDLYQNLPKRKVAHDSIPYGTYRLILISELGDMVEREVTIAQRTKMVINVRSFYNKDASGSNFTDILSDQDTLRIFTRESGCFHYSESNCEITRQDTNYFIHFNSSKGKETFLLKKSYFELIRNTENRGRHPGLNKINQGYWTTNTVYYYSLNRKLLTFTLHSPDFVSNIYRYYKERHAE